MQSNATVHLGDANSVLETTSTERVLNAQFQGTSRTVRGVGCRPILIAGQTLG